MPGARLEKTRWPGIYRRGERWAFEWTDAAGKRRRGSADTREKASAAKAAEEAKAAAGALPDSGGRSRVTVADYAREWIGADLDRANGAEPERGRYTGRRGAIRSATRDDYRRIVETYALPVLGGRPLAKVSAADLSRWIADVAARDGDDCRADKTLKRIFAPVSAMFASAVEDGLLRGNPARDVRVPSGRDDLRRFDEDADDGDDPQPGRARALTRAQVVAVLAIVDPRWRTFFQLLAATGLRVSEALALRWRDLALDGDRPVVRVRRAYVRGTFGPPKSRSGRRDVPIGHDLVRALRARRRAAEWHQDDDVVFPNGAGKPMDVSNLMSRVLVPAVQEAGVSWARFHAFRHFAASALIEDGRSIVQVSKWLGHASPGFTLSCYAHLLDGGVGAPLDLEGVVSGSCSGVRDVSVGLDFAEATS